jgi:hypothetical protein
MSLQASMLVISFIFSSCSCHPLRSETITFFGSCKCTISQRRTTFVMELVLYIKAAICFLEMTPTRSLSLHHHFTFGHLINPLQSYIRLIRLDKLSTFLDHTSIDNDWTVPRIRLYMARSDVGQRGMFLLFASSLKARQI